MNDLIQNIEKIPPGKRLVLVMGFLTQKGLIGEFADFMAKAAAAEKGEGPPIDLGGGDEAWRNIHLELE